MKIDKDYISRLRLYISYRDDNRYNKSRFFCMLKDSLELNLAFNLLKRTLYKEIIKPCFDVFEKIFNFF